MSRTAPANPLQAYQWLPQPESERVIRELVDHFLTHNNFAAEFAEMLLHQAGVRFFDLVDEIALPVSSCPDKELLSVGFAERADENDILFTQPQGIFPAVRRWSRQQSCVQMKVEFVSDFASVWHFPSSQIQGEPTAPCRKLLVSEQNNAALIAVERHGYRADQFPNWPTDKTASALKHLEAFRTRIRNSKDEDAGFGITNQLVDEAISDLGVDYSCDLFFRAEREYWQRRNHAARAQKARQDRLGIGWANHDHHTYRSSRKYFSQLIALQEKLGLVSRERFYAGKEAGWGAQVMEQPVARIITFNDVDLSPEELFGDFAHEPLPERDHLGTVGLWCALHGEAMLQAGMHHLECQFSFDALRDQLAKEGVKTMKPFTDFSYLRQAFTEGERWPVADRRLTAALKAGYITQAQADQFGEHGAIGSHLENLERNQGFKGFNQTGVSEIISATDPRKQLKQDPTGVAADG